MPGLLGYVNNEKDIAKSEKSNLINSMCNSIMHEDWYKTDLLHGDNFALARVHQNIFNPEPQPIYNKDKSLCIFMYGKIYGYENDFQRLENNGYVFKYRNDAEYCLYLFEEKGTDFVKELNGSFVICIYNLNEDVLYLFNDRYGLRPTYYINSNNKFIFSFEIKAILQDQDVPKKISKLALGQFFYYGQLLGNTTFVEDVKVLPPASILIYKNNELEIYKYWEFVYKTNDNISEKEFVNMLVDSWKKAVKIRLQDNHKYGLALSGGLDSRSILGAIPSEKIKGLFTFTFGSEKSGEVFIAKKAAKTVDAQHFAIDIDLDDSINNYAEDAVNINDGMNGIATSIILSTYEKVRDKVDVCFDGLAGDALLGGGYLNSTIMKICNDKDYIKYETSKIDTKAIFSKQDMIKLFKNDEIFCNLTSKYINNYLSKRLNTTPENKHDSVIMYNTRVRRHTILGDDQMRSKFEEATPTFDNEFVDICLQIPSKWRINHRIYRKFLIKLSPNLSKIKYLATGIPVNAPIFIWELGRNYKRLIRKVEKIIDNISRGRIKFYKKNEGEIDLKEWIRNNNNWQVFVKDKLEKLPNDIFNKDYVNSLFQDHIQCKRDNSAKISHLVSFSIFYNKYIRT